MPIWADANDKTAADEDAPVGCHRERARPTEANIASPDSTPRLRNPEFRAGPAIRELVGPHNGVEIPLRIQLWMLQRPQSRM